MELVGCQDRLGHFSWSQNDSNYLDVNLKVFKKDDKKELQLVRNLTMGDAGFGKFMGLRNQLSIAAENYAREENMSPLLIPTMSKDMVEQLRLAHNVVYVVHRANRAICVFLLRCNVDKPESS